MELLKDIIVDFCLFSFIEGWIYCLFLTKINNNYKFKWNEIFILSLGNSIISQLVQPMFYQIIMTLWVGIITNIKTKIKLHCCIKYCVIFSLLLLIIEMPPCVCIEVLFNIDFSTTTIIKLFIINIPFKILEIFIIKRGDLFMKWWAGEIVK